MRSPPTVKESRHDADTRFNQPVIERITSELVNGTVGFEQLAGPTQMLQMDNLVTNFDAVRGWLKVSMDVRVVEAV